MPMAAWGQSITAADDGTGTVVNATGNQYDISEGTQAGENLFHSFEQLGLSEGEIANFLSNPDIENILGRVTGGDASFINGLIQVSGGDANLFLMNPAGIIFGENAQLNVPTDFSATTANAIGIDQDWFRSLGSNDYGALTGAPESFAFASDSPGAIVNAGDLSVDVGQQIQLVGGLLVNTGTLSTLGGEITVEAVPGEGLVTVTQAGNLLSLGLPVATEVAVNGGQAPVVPQTLPQLLSRAEGSNATGISVDGDVVRLTRADTVIPTDAGVAIASGSLDVTDAIAGSGGNIDVLGQRIALIGARIEASGTDGGGEVRVGGDYRGRGVLPNAELTYMDSDSVINANAELIGSGGNIILWSDRATDFYGSVNAQGGETAGNGGFVEVSGEEVLNFNGLVNISTFNGSPGTLLIDPDTLTIVDSVDPDGEEYNQFDPNGSILENSPNTPSNQISWTQINQQGQNTNMILEATGNITIDDINRSETPNLVDVSVVEGGTLTISSIEGDVVFIDRNDTIRLGKPPNNDTVPNNLEISGRGLLLGGLEASGYIHLTALSNDIVAGNIDALAATPERAVTLEALNGNITVETISSGSGISAQSEGFFRAIGASPFDTEAEQEDPESKVVVLGNGDITYHSEYGLPPISIALPEESELSIQHGEDSFRISLEDPDNLPTNGSFTAGAIQFREPEVLFVPEEVFDSEGNSQGENVGENTPEQNRILIGAGTPFSTDGVQINQTTPNLVAPSPTAPSPIAPNPTTLARTSSEAEVITEPGQTDEMSIDITADNILSSADEINPDNECNATEIVSREDGSVRLSSPCPDRGSKKIVPTSDLPR